MSGADWKEGDWGDGDWGDGDWDEGDWRDGDFAVSKPKKGKAEPKAKANDVKKEKKEKKPAKAKAVAAAPVGRVPQVQGSSVPVQSFAAVIAGHVDAGKSTLMGHLLVDAGVVSTKELRKLETESKDMGKGTFAFAWVFDEGRDERERGVTVEVCVRHVKLPNDDVWMTVLDAPGHSELVPTFLHGALLADVALLVVDGASGGFERGFEGNGQTREHAEVLVACGVRRFAVAVNKMDQVGWSKERFDDVSSRVATFLTECVADADVAAASAGASAGAPLQVVPVPVSGWTGQNLLFREAVVSPNSSSVDFLPDWVQEGYPTLADALSSLGADVLHQPLAADVCEAPLRMPVFDWANTGKTKATLVGRVESGALAGNLAIACSPAKFNLSAPKTFSIRDCKTVLCCGPGTFVDELVVDTSGLQLPASIVITDADHPIAPPKLARVRLTCLRANEGLIKGMPVTCHGCCGTSEAFVKKIFGVFDAGTLAKARCIHAGQCGEVDLALDGKLLVDALGGARFARIVLRSDGRTIAVGRVLEVKETC